LGAYRGVIQTISYEVRLAFIILRVVRLEMGFDFHKLVFFQKEIIVVFGLFLLFLVWLVTFLAETNRTPFDFSEGESELVSGFNVEFGSGLFAFLFMAEYGNIIFFSFLTSLMFFGKKFIIFFFNFRGGVDYSGDFGSFSL